MAKEKNMGKLFAFSILFLIFLSCAYAIDGCKGSVISSDDIPCLLLLPFNQTDLNCASYSITINNVSNILYSTSLSNYSPFMCSAINNISTPGTYNAQYSTGDTADWNVVGGNKMIYLIYLAILVFFVIFVIALWQKDANVGAVSAFGFMSVGLFIYLLSNNLVSISGFTIPNNLITASLAIILIGFGALVMGNSMEEWFSMFG